MFYYLPFLTFHLDTFVTDQSRYVVSTTEELQFNPMRRDEAGQYECSAENGVGSSLGQTDHSFCHWYNF